MLLRVVPEPTPTLNEMVGLAGVRGPGSQLPLMSLETMGGIKSAGTGTGAGSRSTPRQSIASISPCDLLRQGLAPVGSDRSSGVNPTGSAARADDVGCGTRTLPVTAAAATNPMRIRAHDFVDMGSPFCCPAPPLAGADSRFVAR